MTKTIRLTPEQLAVLRELAKPGCVALYVNTRRSSYWFVTSTMKHLTAQITSLCNSGLLYASGPHLHRRANITESGRAYLAALDAKDGQG